MVALASTLTTSPVALLAAPASRPDIARECALAYAGFWITGYWYLMTSHSPLVRRHAAISTGVFGGLSLLNLAISNAQIPFRVAFLGASAVAALGIALWIVLVGRAMHTAS